MRDTHLKCSHTALLKAVLYISCAKCFSDLTDPGNQLEESAVDSDSVGGVGLEVLCF